MRKLSLLLSFLAMLAAGSFSSAQTLVGHWAMEEGMGGTTADSSGGGNTGTLFGNTGWITSGLAPVPSGTTAALTFDGAGDGVNTTFAGIGGSNPLTVSGWVRTTDTSDAGIVAWGDSNVDGRKFHVHLNSNVNNGTVGALRAEVQGGYIIGDDVLSDDQWHHFAVVSGGTAIENALLFVDGKLQASSGIKLQSINIDNTAEPVTIGVRDQKGTPHYIDGDVDDVRIYDDRLSLKAVAQLAGVEFVPNGQLNYDAELDTSPANGTWEESNGITPMDGAVGAGVSHQSVNSSSTKIKSAYNFTGAGGVQFANNFEDGLPDDITNSSATFEVWLRPSDLSGNEVVLDAGGTTDGSSFTLAGSNLQLKVADSGTTQTLTADLSGADLSDFIQAVGVVDLDNNSASLYLDGELVASGAYAGADWAGTNDGGLGDIFGGQLGGDLAGFGAFDGDIASFRFFSSALSAQDIQDLFDAQQAAVPEPASVVIWSLLGLALTGFGYRRFRRKK